MRYETKLAILLAPDLAVWQKLNITAFLAGGLVGQYPELTGEAYRDGDGQVYGPLIRQPVMVFEADAASLAASLRRAGERGLTVTVFTRALFGTGNDPDNRAAVAGVPTAELDLVGLGLYGPRNAIDRLTKGLRLHG